ncbi:ftsH protease activity modulator HflK [Caballeronia arationis]|jgi:membrane protease subunit HflK|uniref:Protein HflK n=1 Tax=Caballeronia arationis TaxID=1777142 RepID=A0A7Z7I9Q8_9BURK|nr:ftsH protease activity modulator HflK [Caballeronia arationis]SOE81517.1 protease FtsH subunit HflK [Caballeronia arationis]
MVNHRVNDYNERSNRQHSHAVFSIDDPRWGRGDSNGGSKNDQKRPSDPKRPGNGRDGEGPPDLDEMWRDFNRRLAGLFGKKPDNGAPRTDNGRGAKIGFGIVVGVLIAIYLGSGVFVVQDGHVGVVSQFGKFKATADQGIHWRLPYPFQSHEIVNTAQIRSVEVGRNNALTQSNVRDASLLTQDADIVDVRFAVQYQIKSPTDYLFRNLDPDQSVMQAGQAAIREIAGAEPTDNLLYNDREALRARLIDTIQRSLDAYKTGLQVTGVTLQSVQVPSQVQAAFEEAAKVRQDNERARDTARAYANQLLPRAKSDAARSIDEATAYSNRVVAQAQGDAERYKQVYSEYSKAPAVVRQRMYLDTMQQIYSRATKVFVDSKAGNNVIYLPLDKLAEATKQRAGEAAGATGAADAASGASAAVAPATASGAAAATALPASAASAGAASGASQGAANDPLRSRDAFRTRTRQDDLQ